jgi:hypothetical protein
LGVSDGSSAHVAVPPLTGVVPTADELVPPAQPAAARASAITPTPTAMVLLRSLEIHLR